MSIVVEAIESVVDAVDKYIVQPIAEDPLTFIATVAATYYLGPIVGSSLGVGANVGAGIAAAAGNTAAGLAQGEDFDEAVKGGALAGVTTWAGGELFGKAGSTSTIDDSITAAGKTGTSTTGTAGTAATQSADEILAASAKPSASSFGASTADDLTAEAAKSWGGSGQAATGTLDDTLSLNSNLPSKASTVPPANTTAQYMKAPSSATNATSAANPTVTADTTGGGVYTGAKNAAVNTLDDSVTLLDEAAARDPNYYLKAQAADDLAAANKVPSMDQTSANVLNSPILKQGTGYNPSAPTQPTFLDKALGYGKDAYKWAINNPEYSIPLALTGAQYLMGDEPDPPKGDGSNKIGEPSFYEPMQNLRLNRSQIDYEGDLSTYGQTGGEHTYFTPSVYEPIAYEEGGEVNKLKNKYSYYTYGNIPQTMQKFAKGGISSLSNVDGFDGRSDDIPAVLSDGEFVFDAETVALLGNGSSKAGANRLEEMRKSVRKQKGGALSKGNFSPDAKHPLAYLKSTKKSRG